MARPIIRSHAKIMEAIADHIRSLAEHGRHLRILEAGCGQLWEVKLGDVEFRLVGVDLDEAAMMKRKRDHNDLDEAIVADIRNVELAPASFDVIYSSFVLEHISGAEEILDKFIGWLKPGGLLILFFPDRDSVYGFFTRFTPLWVHVLYWKYLQGYKNAGKPGYGPYATYHDPVIARRNFQAFVSRRGLRLKAEFALEDSLPPMQRKFTDVVARLSLGTLVSDYTNLCYVLQRPHGYDVLAAEEAVDALDRPLVEATERSNAWPRGA